MSCIFWGRWWSGCGWLCVYYIYGLGLILVIFYRYKRQRKHFYSKWKYYVSFSISICERSLHVLWRVKHAKDSCSNVQFDVKIKQKEKCLTFTKSILSSPSSLSLCLSLSTYHSHLNCFDMIYIQQTWTHTKKINTTINENTAQLHYLYWLDRSNINNRNSNRSTSKSFIMKMANGGDSNNIYTTQ